MSKIKDMYAIENGIDDLIPVDETDIAFQMAHQAYEIEKETIINKLEMLIADTNIVVYKQTLAEAIEFIRKGEV